MGTETGSKTEAIPAVAQEKPKKRGNPAFGPGNKIGPGAGHRSEATTAKAMLDEMEYVAEHPNPEPGKKIPPIRKALRKLLETEPGKFIDRLLALRKKTEKLAPEPEPAQITAVTPVVTSVVTKEEIEIKVDELITRLLAEWEKVDEPEREPPP